MKKTHFQYILTAIAILVVASVLFGTIMLPSAQAAAYRASFVNKLELGAPVDLEQYLDNSVMFRLPDTVKDDDEISVIITVDVVALMDAYEHTDKSVSFTEYALTGEDAEKIRGQIHQERSRILAALDEAGVTYTAGDTYDTILSGFALDIFARDFEATCKTLGKGEGIIVGEVYHVAETKLVENTVNVYETGIFKSEGSGYDGSGMVVAVLDTGLDSNHSAFSVNNFTSQKLGLTYSDVASVIGQTTANKLAGGLTADDVYINEKVPYGYDYADNDPDVYSTHNNHGTHVSGVIVGKDDTITGVAPNAQLVSMKVFSDIMDTARSTWILSALEDCVVLGVDVINMSLGTACGFSRESDEELMNGVYDKIRAAGISMVVAASNSYSSAYGSEANGNLGLTSNPDTGTVGSPGTYKGVISVSSINGVETPYILYGDTIIYFDESNTGAAEEIVRCYPGLPVYLNRRDAVEGPAYVRQIFPQISGAVDYDEGDIVEVGILKVSVMATPGHSLGSVTLRCGDVLFCGDTLFAGSCGRTDLPGGSMKSIMASLKRLGELEGDYKVLSGHMEDSTLERERKWNPYLTQALRG